MKTSVVGIAAVLALAGAANADVEHVGLTAHLVATAPVSQAFGGGLRAVDPDARYSNVTTFLGQAFANGGSAGGITRLVADDLTPTGVNAGQAIGTVRFSVTNLSTAAVTARPRIRFWNADGTAGAPGSVYSNPVAVGFSFNAITFPANSVQVFQFNPAAGTFNMPGTTFWAGMCFDNNAGATGATDADLNFLGQGMFDPVDVGSSTDNIFVTTAAGSFFGTANPAGTVGNLGGNPIANLGWEFTAVPAPGAAALLGLGGLLAARRRRA